ncbi:hypothetical protein M514_02213 [Trichuris suis]|uniref:Uncharacterized protein n=1 Tax=Trichuris suis TaxID=68888 RepID=A0A085NKR4_9BILA|nr:hypothetical protein M513_02213 [Trichuris suis]KFD70060.1 hypothetical protein M514_02213 [Trichuris suis]
MELSCNLSSLDGLVKLQLDRAIAVSRLDAGARVVHLSAIKAEWQHLKDLPFASVALGPVDVLIGMDVQLAHRHSDMRCDSRCRSSSVTLENFVQLQSSLHFSGDLQEKRSQLVVVNYLVPARCAVIGLPLGERSCDS